MTKSITDATSPVCHNCLKDNFLKERVRGEGGIEQCHFCGTRAECITIEKLSGWVVGVLKEHYQGGAIAHCRLDEDTLAVIDYEQAGEDLKSIVGGMIKIDMDSKVVGAVLNGLPADYNDEARYVEMEVDVYAIYPEWNQFRQELKHRSRFFNAYARNFLDRLMKDINTLHAPGLLKTPVIHEMEPNDLTKFYRARRADKQDQLERILKAPLEQLGPPPPRLATASRMNAVGISVFYGSFDRKTCIAELRPSIGSTVVSAEFRLRKPIRVLDFKLLERCYHEQPLSYFQPNFNEKVINRHFLQQLHSIIRQPVLPGYESEYLITQVLSEYLSEIVQPSIDGILFSSVQWKEGLNVVLFSRALDIQLDDNHGATMGPDSALILHEGSVLAHRIKGIDYQFDNHLVKEGKVEPPWDEDEDLDDYE